MSHVQRNRASKITKEISNSKLTEVINEWIHSERDRNIMKRRYVDGITYEQLSDEFGMSVRQIKNIVYRHDDVLIKYL